MKIRLLTVFTFLTTFCHAQITSDSIWNTAKDSNIHLSNYLTYSRDTCWWEKRVDTIQTDFIIIVNENNFVKKLKTDFIIYEYETKRCEGLGIWSFTPNRNNVFLLNNKPVEVLIYKPKNQRVCFGEWWEK